MKLLLLPLLALCSMVAMAEPETKSEDGVHHVDAKEAAKLLTADPEKRPVVIDVRTAPEFEDGHLKDAKNIDYIDDGFEAELAKLDKEKPYLVHCQSGRRSTKSLEMFKKLGFKNVYHLDGGFAAWKKADQEVVK